MIRTRRNNGRSLLVDISFAVVIIGDTIAVCLTLLFSSSHSYMHRVSFFK